MSGLSTTGTTVGTKIPMKLYARLAGQLGVTNIRRDRNGTSWMLPDGRVVSERVVEGGWEYYLLEA